MTRLCDMHRFVSRTFFFLVAAFGAWAVLEQCRYHSKGHSKGRAVVRKAPGNCFMKIPRGYDSMAFSQ